MWCVCVAHNRPHNPNTRFTPRTRHLRESLTLGVYVESQAEETVASATEAIAVVARGLKNRRARPAILCRTYFRGEKSCNSCLFFQRKINSRSPNIYGRTGAWGRPP